MKKGLLTTLFAAAVSFAGIPVAFASAPVISNIPDITVGDMEDNVPVGTDNNFFVFTNAFQFSTSVNDADTTDGALRWSFGEFDSLLASPQYTINGKPAVNQGSTAIANDEGLSSPRAKDPANASGFAGGFQINQSSDYATVRDILFSPPPSSGPFPNPTPGDAANAALGRPVRFYVADPDGNLTSETVIINTVDDGFDAVSGGSVLDPTNVDDSGWPAGNGWVGTGFDSGTIMDTNPPASYFFDPSSTNDVDKTSDTDKLNIIVRTSQHRWRSTGFENTNMLAHPGSSKWIRGKFYVYVDNAPAAAMNTVPGFRARLTTPGYFNSLYIEAARTGNTGPIDPVIYTDTPDATTVEANVSSVLAPSRTPSKPSLYRLDFDPIDVPAELTRPIGALFECYAFTNPTVGTISLTECEVGAYPAYTTAEGTQILNYTRATTAASQGITLGQFVANFDDNLEVGRKPALDIQGLGDPGPYGTITEAAGATANGISVDTSNTPTNKRGVLAFSLYPSANTAKPRHAPGKIYQGRYYITSNLNSLPALGTANTADRQAPLRVSMNAMSSVALVHMDMNGGLMTANTTGDNTAAYQICKETLPGPGSANPTNDPALNPAGMTGGWISVMTSSMLDPDIRQDESGDLTPLINEPGPGSSLASRLDMIPEATGIRLPRFMRFGPTPPFDNLEFAAFNNARWSVTAVRYYEYPQINDGGYGY